MLSLYHQKSLLPFDPATFPANLLVSNFTWQHEAEEAGSDLPSLAGK